MRLIISTVCVCLVFPAVKPLEPQPIQNGASMHNPKPPLEISRAVNSSITNPINKPNLEFPSKETDVSTPILIGDNPQKSHLPPKVFPSKEDKDVVGRPIVSSDNVGNPKKNLDKEHRMDLKKEEISENGAKQNPPQGSKEKIEQSTAEQEDMLHSKYTGGQDVDELHPEKKTSENDEKKEVAIIKDPKGHVSVSSDMDKNGPKLMNETKTKSGESMLESTSKMMAVSSSVLANTQPKQHGIIEPGKTLVSVLITAVALVCLGVLGLLVWRKIAMRRFGRDVLINEDDFDEVADMHTFDRAQIQIT